MPSATTVYNSAGTAYAAGTTLAVADDYVSITLDPNTPAGPDGAALFGFSGTFTTATISFEGQLVASGAWVPVKAINDLTGAPVTSNPVSLTNSTAHLFRLPNVAGLYAIRARLAAISTGGPLCVGKTYPASAVPAGAGIAYFNATTLVGPTLTGTTTVTGALAATSPTAGVGYATGAGGAVTQASSITTAVTLNTVTGTITTVSSTLAAGVDASFTLTNSAIAATDTVVINTKSYAGTADGIPIAKIQSVAAGSCIINVHNQGAVTLDSTIVISFCVIKGVAA